MVEDFPDAAGTWNDVVLVVEAALFPFAPMTTEATGDADMTGDANM